MNTIKCGRFRVFSVISVAKRGVIFFQRFDSGTKLRFSGPV